MNLSEDKKRLFAERLRLACIAKNDNKAHGVATMLARLADVSIQTASKWINGKAVPETYRWAEIASLLGVDSAWLIGASHTPPSGVAYDQKEIKQVTHVAKMVFPLISRLVHDATQEKIEDVMGMAYKMSLDGASDEAITGAVVSKLLK